LIVQVPKTVISLQSVTMILMTYVALGSWLYKNSFIGTLLYSFGSL